MTIEISCLLKSTGCTQSNNLIFISKNSSCLISAKMHKTIKINSGHRLTSFRYPLESSSLMDFPRTAHTLTEKKADADSGPKYCLNLVQKNDHENFLCTLLMNSGERRHAFALRAFNVEVAKCNSNVSEDHIAKMRLKFWHDSVDKCFSKQKSYVSDHPVLRELKNTIDEHNLSKMYLKRIVSSRDRPSNLQFVTLQEMEEYSEQAFSSLLYLLAECKNMRDLNVDHALSHLGKAQGITTLLRAVPYMGRNQALNIPQDVMISHSVSQERILRHNSDDRAVEDCIFAVATAAYQHLDKARQLMDKVPHPVRKIFLPAIAIERYLERLRKANFRLTHQSCLQRDSLLPMALYWHSLRGKY